jgi:hypothetical protein
MQGQHGFWDFEDGLKVFLAQGDSLERLSETVDFAIFWPVLSQALRRSHPSKGGRSAFDPVL